MNMPQLYPKKEKPTRTLTSDNPELLPRMGLSTLYRLRIGRKSNIAIMSLLLARSDSSKIRFYSMSNQIFKEHKHYSEIVEKTQKGTNEISEYMEWFLGCFERAKNLFGFKSVKSKREL